MALQQPTSRRCRGASSPRKIRPSPITKSRAIEKRPSPKPAVSKHLNSFHSFAKLPTELRLRIWELSLPSPRLVPIQCGSNGISRPESSPTTLASLRLDFTTTGCMSSAPVPVNLHVCTESRLEALQTYRSCFGFARGPGQILFNPEIDIMYFGPCEGFMAANSQFRTCMMLCDQQDLASVRRLAINDALFWIGNMYSSMTAARFTLEVLREVATRMTGLEELIFVPWEEEHGDHEDAIQGRMARQIQTAMQSISQQFPSWEPPPWSIVPLSELPSMAG
ncbi:hypothetical protein TGAM01_v206293 [Trichoderma gamsii]|uniref:2EXR domain-containing protein n=1 Tax=Trichoderma gamsii TaxID=398673 RepID=A0A2P4ZKL8_9HYPO|nr:hypothetical protein TGAM01_v206293 [Trichoderma gamsii]PON24785.1 hypothetical protein TGAM01_v206293 [Trichoderma gamsii]